MLIKFRIPKLNNCSLLYILTFLLFLNSGFYFNSFPAVSPVYIIFYITLFYLIFREIKTNESFKLPIQSALGLIAVIYILLSQLFVCGRFIAILGSIVTFSFYILGTILLPKMNYQKVLFLCKSILIYYIIIYGADTIYRLALFKFNLAYLFTGLNFYEMKVATLLYADTNTIGINTTILALLAYYIFKITKQKSYIKYVIIYSILNILSFSRASIFAEILTLILLFLYEMCRKIIKKSQNHKYWQISLNKLLIGCTLVTASIIGLFILLKIIIYINTDPSFYTKIELFNTLKRFLKEAPLKDLLFGIGYNNGRLFEYGSERGYAHTYLLTYLCETGICGYIAVTSYLGTILFKTPKTIIILFPFFIIGISLIAHTQLHLFYTVLALMWYFERYPYIGVKE